MNKYLLTLVVVVLVGVAFMMWPKQTTEPTDQSSNTEVATTTQTQSYAWTFNDKGEDASGMPSTEVSLNGKVVGTYSGRCSVIKDTSWKLLDGEKDGVICWWAGGGDEIGVFEGGIVKTGDLSEGDAETAGTRGNFKTLFTI